MIRRIDRIAAALVALLGLFHLAVGRAVFTDPTGPRVWFAAAGFLLVTTGLANLAASSRPNRLQSAAALSGNLALVILGALIAKAEPQLLREPQTLLLIAIGLFLSVRRVGEMGRR